MRIGPHPHCGLQTVTWLIGGEALHCDSLGSEQILRPGSLNLMTAGGGVSHSEESSSTDTGAFHGIQLWVAQPEATRHGPAAFEHHQVLPKVELDGGGATVLIGDLAGHVSPARRDTDHSGVELNLRTGVTTVPCRESYEHALVVLDGSIRVGSMVIEPGKLAYRGPGHDQLVIEADGPAVVMMLGGVPFGETITMWWNFVARTADEIASARHSWETDDGRFGTLPSHLDRYDAPPLR